MITIYDKSGNAKLSVPISEKCVYFKGIMEEEYVTLPFVHQEALQLANGDYIDTEFGRFEIIKLASPEDKTSGDGGYHFEQRFNPSWWRGINAKLFYNRQSGYEASWKMTHYAYYFMDIVVDNLRRAGIGEYTYEIDASITAMKFIQFDGVNIIDGLNLIAEAFEAEWWFTDNVLHLGRCEYGEPVRMGVDAELATIEPEESSDTEYATRIFVFGAARNLPKNYRKNDDNLVIEGVVETRLRLPEGIDYIDAQEDLAEEDIVESIVKTDDIYPRRTGTIATVATKQYTETIENEDGTTTEEKWNAFRFTDTGITFSEEYIIAGEELRIIFQSGKLVGLDFAVTFNPDGANEDSDAAQLWEIVRNDDYGVNLPADDFAPDVGDTYILYGYDTSFIADNLLEDAEQELLDFGTEIIKQMSRDKSNYNCETNPVRCAGYIADEYGVMQYNESEVIDLDVGSMVDLAHPVYFPGSSHVGRIRSFEKHLDNRYRCSYTVGEAKGYSHISELAGKIEALSYQSKQYTPTAGSNVYLIKRKDSTTPSEHNAYSSVRARIEFMCRSVAEYVRTHWTFIKGLSVGSYKNGESGARIDESGNAEVGDLATRGDAEVGGDATVNGTATARRVVARGDVVTPRLTTPNFRKGGLTGEGGGMYTDETGLTHAEYDYIVARRGLVLSVLTIEEINSVAGGIVASKAHGEVESVNSYTASDGSTRYVVYLKDVNMFQFGDLVRFARWDYTNNAYRWAWVPVRGCDTAKRFINIWASDLTDGMSVPETGDKLVQMGNQSDTLRQGFVYITDNGVQCFDGVSTASLVGKCRGAFGDLSGITDNGKALSGYGVWSDTMYIGTGKTVYETFTDVVASISATNNALADYKTEVTSRFDVVAGEMSSVQKAVTSLQTGGGRNLLLRTNRGVTNWGCLTNSASRPAMFNGVDGCVEFDYIAGNYATSYEIYVFKLRPELIVQGRTYTLTVEVLDTTGVSGLYFYLNIANNDSSGRLMYDVVADKPLMQEAWTRLAFTFTAISTGSAEGAQQIRLIVPQDKLGQLGFVSFRNLKLEEGDVATAYTAAPEDYVDGEITAVRETVSAIEQTSDEIKTRVEEVNTSLTGRITANTSSITQNADSITSEVAARESGDKELRTMINQTADSISLKVSELGIKKLNYAYGTGKAVEITSFQNRDNQTARLYEVTGLSGGEKISVSCLLRVKNIIFDTDSATANNRTSAIYLQFNEKFGYKGLGITITADTFKDADGNQVTPDDEGYINVRIKREGLVLPMYQWVNGGANSEYPITPDVVSVISTRLDFIDSETDDEGNDIGSILIEEMMIERGGECTAWTYRTQDMEKSLQATGVDIENKRIVATADKFIIQNNLGQITASVDEDGNLATGTVLCWNKDEATKNATPYLVTLNRDGNGYLEWYYPLPEKNASDNISIQFGWEECIDETGQDTSSIFRFFKKDGTLAWKGGDFTEFLMNMKTETVTTITPKSFHYIGAMTLADAKNKVQNILSLSANATLYLKTVQVDGKITESYYCTDSSGKNKANGGAYTLPGTPLLGLIIEGSSTTSYRRTLYSPNNGIMQLDFVEWSTSYKDIDDSIIDSPSLPNQ